MSQKATLEKNLQRISTAEAIAARPAVPRFIGKLALLDAKVRNWADRSSEQARIRRQGWMEQEQERRIAADQKFNEKMGNLAGQIREQKAQEAANPSLLSTHLHNAIQNWKYGNTVDTPLPPQVQSPQTIQQAPVAPAADQAIRIFA